ncbi:MAG: AraC family transcriptional regulator [Burkholderiaceae bacterium]|jgi:AraC-like DNA-binding protein|nr:AraC family transcriptional regulator [Burkholderiaceae bacterium]
MVPSSTAEVTTPARHLGIEARWKRPPDFQAPGSPAAAVPAPPLPSKGIRFTSDDLDEVRAEVQRQDGEHSRVVHGRGRLGFDRHVLPGRLTPLAWGRLGLAHTLRGALAARYAVVQMPVEGASQYRFGARQHTVVPGGAVFVAPSMEFTRRSDAGSMFVIAVDAVALDLELRSRRPEDDRCATHWVLKSSASALDPAHTRQVAAQARRLWAALHAGDAPERVDDHGQTRLVSLIADAVLAGRAAVAMPGVAASRLAALEAWIDANLHEPLTVGRLCLEAGVGARSLQLAFQARRGMSPMRFVLERRLSAAHRLLRNGRLNDDVTGIAGAAGFSHLGRFAALYRQAFGERPSDTYRQARRS